MDDLLKTDKKLTDAVIRCGYRCRFEILLHSPQEDFFDLVEEDK